MSHYRRLHREDTAMSTDAAIQATIVALRAQSLVIDGERFDFADAFITIAQACTDPFTEAQALAALRAEALKRKRARRVWWKPWTWIVAHAIQEARS